MRPGYAPFGHSGGAIVSDAGSLSLAAAHALARFYAAEARQLITTGAGAWSRRCADRARSLEEAIAAAVLWRRAAGWRRPEEADCALD